jgi:hypothetical protein
MFAHKDLYRQVEIFLANAGAEDIAPMLMTEGCGSEFLEHGTQLRQSWFDAQVEADNLKNAKEAATAAQKAAHQTAHLEIVRLTGRLRGELGHNKPLMKRLGLQPKSKKDDTAAEAPTTEAPTPVAEEAAMVEADAAPADEADANGTEPTAKKRAGSKGQYSLAADIARWRQLCTRLATLTEDEQRVMTTAGWPPKRIAATSALVEAVAEADNVQQAAVQRKEAGTADARSYEKQLRHWYSRAVRRAKDAINKLDPANRDYWLKKLGLKPNAA